MNHVYALRRTLSLIAFFFGLLPFSIAATFTVTTTAATGLGSLDQAIQDANSTAGADNIVFAIPGAGPHIITPAFPGLPAITEAVTIDGYTQPGASAGPMATRVILIGINGALAGFSNGLTINADNVTVSGLSISQFGNNGIDIGSGIFTTWLWGNFIGTDPSGLVAAGNANNGINLGGNAGPGGSDGVIIGTNSDGINDNGEGNIISDNGQDGIFGWALTNSIISGNFIGSDRTGTGTTFGNLRHGVLLTVGSTDNRIGTNGDGVNDTEELNGLIMNGSTGITLAAGSNSNAIAGNIIGLNTLGAPAGNDRGIEIINSSNNRIGIDVTHANFAVESNVISSNAYGITLIAEDFFTNIDPNSGNIIAGNYIGTTPTNDVRGNTQNGIRITSDDGVLNVDHIIGSNNDGNSDNAEGNIIANNGVIGIAIGGFPGSSTTTDINGISISRNSISNSGALGIDIVGNPGVTANDDGDPDTGPNEIYNFPVITSNIVALGTNLIVTGISRPGSIIEVYLADGSGEGATFLFRAQEGTTLNGITDAAAGTAMYSDPTYGTFTDNAFEFTVPVSSLPAPLPPGSQLVALGIKPDAGDNSTSEFGPAIALLPVTLTGFKGQLLEGVVKLSWTTSREWNSSHFIVEKSIDGSNYISIGRVNSGVVGGQYSLIDKTALGKVNYYRLRIVDIDQNYTFSKTLLIRNDAEPAVFKLSPNPVGTYLNVSFKLEKDEVVRLNIYDQMGRLSKRYSLQGGRGINAFTISDLGNLSAGNYVVEILGETLSVKQQIIKR